MSLNLTYSNSFDVNSVIYTCMNIHIYTRAYLLVKILKIIAISKKILARHQIICKVTYNLLHYEQYIIIYDIFSTLLFFNQLCYRGKCS